MSTQVTAVKIRNTTQSQRHGSPPRLSADVYSVFESFRPRKLAILLFFIVKQPLSFCGQGHRFWCLFCCLLKMYRAIHVRPCKSCYPTLSMRYWLFTRRAGFDYCIVLAHEHISIKILKRHTPKQRLLLGKCPNKKRATEQNLTVLMLMNKGKPAFDKRKVSLKGWLAQLLFTSSHCFSHARPALH